MSDQDLKERLRNLHGRVDKIRENLVAVNQKYDVSNAVNQAPLFLDISHGLSDALAEIERLEEENAGMVASLTLLRTQARQLTHNVETCVAGVALDAKEPEPIPEKPLRLLARGPGLCWCWLIYNEGVFWLTGEDGSVDERRFTEINADASDPEAVELFNQSRKEGQ